MFGLLEINNSSFNKVFKLCSEQVQNLLAVGMVRNEQETKNETY